MANALQSLVFVTSMSLLGCGAVHSNLSERQTELLRAPNPVVAEQPDSADLAVRRARVIPVSAKCAYDVVADIPAWSSWDHSIVDSKMLEGNDVRVGSVFLQRFEDFTARSRILDAERGKVLRWRGQAPDGTGPVGVHTWTFLPQPDGKTLVLNDEHFHAWYVRPVGWVTDLGIGDQFDRTLADLECEAVARCDRS